MAKKRVRGRVRGKSKGDTGWLKGKYTIWDPDPILDEEQKEEKRKELGKEFQLDAKGTKSPKGRKSPMPGRPMTRLEVLENLKARENHGRV